MAGLPLSITLFTHRGREVFRHRLVAEAVFSIVVATDVTLAACLLPDRLHWLIVAAPDWSGRVRRFKSFSTSLAWRCGHTGRLWQCATEDCAEQSERDVRSQAEELVSSPRRAGIVGEAGDYPYRFSRWS